MTQSLTTVTQITDTVKTPEPGQLGRHLADLFDESARLLDEAWGAWMEATYDPDTAPVR